MKIKSNIELVDISKETIDNLDVLGDAWKVYSCMLPEDRTFLAEMVRRVKPKTMVEIGTQNGGGSVIMLQASSDWGGLLASVDIDKLRRYSNGREVPTGYAVSLFPELGKRWKGYFGHMVAAYIEDIVKRQFHGQLIDFVCLDSLHNYPGELLDFICIFPYLSPNATIVIHDTIYLPLNVCTFSILHGHKYFPKAHVNPALGRVRDKAGMENGAAAIRTLIPNIGAVTLDDTQKEHMYDLLHMLHHKWAVKLPMGDIRSINEFIVNNYDDYFLQSWCKILSLQGQPT